MRSLPLLFAWFLRLNEGDDQFQVCNFAFGATIGLQHDTSERLGSLGRFPSRGAEKLQSSDFATEQNMKKIQTTSSRNGHHLYYDTVALKSFTSDVMDGLYMGLTRLHVGGWNLRDLHGAMSSSNRATHRRCTAREIFSMPHGIHGCLTHLKAMCNDI